MTLLNTPTVDSALDIEEEWHVWVDVMVIEVDSEDLAVSGYFFYRVPPLAFADGMVESFQNFHPVFLPHLRSLQFFKTGLLKGYCESFVDNFDEGFLDLYRGKL